MRDILHGAYKGLLEYSDIDVFKMRDEFVAKQMALVEKNNIADVNRSDFYKVPILYHIYKDDAVRTEFIQSLYEYIQTDIENAAAQKVVM
jgi:hypothetical protein